MPNLQWRMIFRSLRLMELSGEVFTGYFFGGIAGIQFISPAALLALQNQENGAWKNKIFWINAMDPISFCRLGLDKMKGFLPRRIASSHLVYDGPTLVLSSSKNGRSIDISVRPDHPSLDSYFDVFRHLLYRDFQALQKLA
ncbi:MAG: ATP-dependent Lhr-like helicase [Candidatus Azotimanducaceae bacterium]|jgi:ATP-dependent Lhr-like helicase